jgi:uncharacterized protein YutE (UPF0331/DUF86 family)
VTRDDLRNKLELLRESLRRLAELPQASFEEFARDFRNVDSALRWLQTSIQALIDVATYKAARLGLGAPGSSWELLEKLEFEGHLPAGSARRFGPKFGFHNRIVHMYDDVDDRIVFRILTEERVDLAELLDLLLAIEDEG